MGWRANPASSASESEPASEASSDESESEAEAEEDGFEKAKAKGGKVTLLAPKPSTLEVLKISGFDKIIAIQA